MGEKITIDQDRLLSILVGLSGSVWSDPDGPEGTVNPKGPGGPVMRYSQALARHFIQVVIASEQINAVREGNFNARSSGKAIAKFVEDFRAGKWATQFPRPIPWPPAPWPPFPPPPIPWPYPPYPWPWPPPPPPPGPGPDPIDYVIVGLEFYAAAQALPGTDFQGLFLEGANQLIQTGLGF